MTRTNNRAAIAHASSDVPTDVAHHPVSGEVLPGVERQPSGMVPFGSSDSVLGHASQRYGSRENLDFADMLSSLQSDAEQLKRLRDASDEDFAPALESLAKFANIGDELRGFFLGRSWMSAVDVETQSYFKRDGSPSGWVEAWFAVEHDGVLVPRKIHQTATQGTALDLFRVGTPCRVVYTGEQPHGPNGKFRLKLFAVQPLSAVKRQIAAPVEPAKDAKKTKK